MEDILDKDHPSFGTEVATFLFTIGSKLVVVEAANSHAVAVIERILILNGQTVSDTCRIICVFRDCCRTGVRDDLVEEIPYVEFMTEIVDPSKLLDDPVTLDGFGKSLTPEEREYAASRAQELESDVTEEVQKESSKVIPENRERLTAALFGMGFKKSVVEKFVRGIGPRADREPITDLIREGLRSCS